jgi:hypothetical protein
MKRAHGDGRAAPRSLSFTKRIHGGAATIRRLGIPNDSGRARKKFKIVIDRGPADSYRPPQARTATDTRTKKSEKQKIS